MWVLSFFLSFLSLILFFFFDYLVNALWSAFHVPLLSSRMRPPLPCLSVRIFFSCANTVMYLYKYIMIMILFEEVYSMARAIVRYLNAKGLRSLQFGAWAVLKFCLLFLWIIIQCPKWIRIGFYNLIFTGGLWEASRSFYMLAWSNREVWLPWICQRGSKARFQGLFPYWSLLAIGRTFWPCTMIFNPQTTKTSTFKRRSFNCALWRDEYRIKYF